MKFHKATARAAILDVLSDGGWHYGLDLMDAARIWSGSLYPVIHDLETDGLVVSAWDIGPEPRRRMYHLTHWAERVGVGSPDDHENENREKEQ